MSLPAIIGFAVLSVVLVIFTLVLWWPVPELRRKKDSRQG